MVVSKKNKGMKKLTREREEQCGRDGENEISRETEKERKQERQSARSSGASQRRVRRGSRGCLSGRRGRAG